MRNKFWYVWFLCWVGERTADDYRSSSKVDLFLFVVNSLWLIYEINVENVFNIVTALISVLLFVASKKGGKAATLIDNGGCPEWEK